jgi:hypothetical protein
MGASRRERVQLDAVPADEIGSEPMEFEIGHVDMGPKLEWFTARCLTCGATRPFRLEYETAYYAIMRHAAAHHDGLVKMHRARSMRVSFHARR